MLLGNRKGLSTVVLFAIVTTLLSCCCSPASSFAFLPRVSRTNDAIIIDFAGVGYAPSYHGKSLYSQIADPAFVPLPSFNPHPMAYRQQQQDPNGWSYSFGYPNPIALEDARSSKQAVAATTTATTQCGKGPTALPKRSSIDQRIAGGSTPTSANSWMYLVTLKMDDAADGIYFCSGTLISDSKVLLAANCLEKLSVNKMSQVTVLIGLRAVAGESSPPPNVQMTRRIGKVAIHSNFNALTFANDIAIITLEYPLVLSNFLVPVCLPPASADPDQFVDQSAVIIGWGTADGTPSTVLSQGTVTVSSNVDCKADTNFGTFASEANMCIASTDKFVCQGDIGGPVLVLSSPGVWTQIGINSYTPPGCTGNSLQTRVSAFRAWIDTYIKN